MLSIPDKPWVVMRAHNDVEFIGQTLEVLHRQTRPFELLALDNLSNDGTRETLAKFTNRIIDVPVYVPGEVLNQGMENTSGEIVVFLNSDCTPVDEYWLERLLEGFTDDQVAAVFGRQIPRPDCKPLYAKDTEDTYGDGHRQKYWRNCFSMASCAIRRSVWDSIKFDGSLCISEDIDWTWRARQAGYTVQYVADSVVMHSHNYPLRSFYQRHFKEGRDEALIYRLTAWERSLLRYSILPWGRQVLSDWKYALITRTPSVIPYAPFLRTVQMVARRKGLKVGHRERRFVRTPCPPLPGERGTPTRQPAEDRPS